LGIDHDPQALNQAQKRLESAYPTTLKNKKSSDASKRFKLVRGNFINITKYARKENFSPAAGILFDLGASTHQLTTQNRGFSFQSDSPLDMRMDPKLTVTAKDLVNGLGRKELYELFTKLAQEHRARAITAFIISARRQKPIETTKELARLVEQAYGGGRRKIHPATKVFQALRIAVNDELNNLKAVLPQAVDLLEPKGRLTVISFHQGEDKIVKHFFKDQENKNIIKLITKKPVIPSREEMSKNPNSRSAKMRVAEKI